MVERDIQLAGLQAQGRGQGLTGQDFYGLCCGGPPRLRKAALQQGGVLLKAVQIAEADPG